MEYDPSRKTVRITLKLDLAITAYRQGQRSGVHALDNKSRLWYARTDQRVRAAVRPNCVELAILTALANTYGTELIKSESLGYVLWVLARDSGESLVQRVLWGETAADMQLAAMLGECRAAFSQIVLAWPADFLVEARAALARCGLPEGRPPVPPSERSNGTHYGKDDPSNDFFDGETKGGPGE
jgi:hypothetical protein